MLLYQKYEVVTLPVIPSVLALPSGAKPRESIPMIGTFYHLMHLSYKKVFGRQHMLHYPLYKSSGESLMQGQMNFTDHCMSRLPSLSGKRLLEIGCGNGVQALYIHDTFRPEYLYGVNINEMHIRLANTERETRNLRQIDFAVDNAQSLASIADESFDVAICTESAHHYPDKEAFLGQLKRVLRPGGTFLIADLLRRKNKEPSGLERNLYLYHWPYQKYEGAFARLQLTLTKEEDLTDLILPAFRATDGWFETQDGGRGVPWYLGRLFGRGLIALYTYELTYSYRYYLMVGRKN